MAQSSPHELYVRMLMERVRRDEYPSSSDLDRIEQSITTGDELGDYLEYLFEKVNTTRPSSQMMNRIERVLAMIPSTSGRSG
jgi:hypothetical protein